MTFRELYVYGADFLEKKSVPDHAFDARQLCLFCLDTDPTSFLMHYSDPVSEEQFAEYRSCLERRAAGEPLQYIIGSWDFFGFSFAVGKGVLIPRAETEQLVENGIGFAKKNGSRIIYDLCAGTGCIGISVAAACPTSEVYLFELYDDAIRYAEENIRRSGLPNLHLIRCDVLNGCPDKIPSPDLILSNPPYIRADEIGSLQKEVRTEPVSSLDGGNDGLDFYRAIVLEWFPLLNAEGAVMMESGEGQPPLICELFPEECTVKTDRDIYSVERFVYVYKK